MKSFLTRLIKADIKDQYMELASGIFTAVVAVLAYLTTFGTKSFSNSVIQPQTIPQIVCAVMFCLGVLLIARWCVKKAKGLVKPGETDEKAGEEPVDRAYVFRKITPAVSFILLALYILALQPLGFVIASALYLTLQIPLLSADLRPGSFLKAFFIGAVTAVIVYLIFARGFGLRLPANGWGF